MNLMKTGTSTNTMRELKFKLRKFLGIKAVNRRKDEKQIILMTRIMIFITFLIMIFLLTHY